MDENLLVVQAVSVEQRIRRITADLLFFFTSSVSSFKLFALFFFAMRITSAELSTSFSCPVLRPRKKAKIETSAIKTYSISQPR